MAKANVLVRRIRAYSRQIEAAVRRAPWRNDERPDLSGERFYRLREKARAELDAFLSTRTKGPWAVYARATA